MRSRPVFRIVPALLALSAALAVSAWAMPAGAPPPADGFTPPEGLIDGWYARIETDRGRILARLLPEQAPQSVAHFAALAEGRLAWTDPVTGETHQEPYYDGIEIHLVKAGMRFEAGDRGGTGRTAPPIYVPREGFGPINFVRPTVLGMTASAGDRISGVVFFVTASSQPWFNGQHPCFGEVVEGADVVWAISESKTYSNGRPIEPVRIQRIRIFAVGEPRPLPEPVPYHPTQVPLEFRGRQKKNGDAPKGVP